MPRPYLVMLRDRIIPLASVGLLLVLCVLVFRAPAEAQLGNLVRLIYVHGALVWTGLLAFSIAGVLGLVALVTRRSAWYRATRAGGLAALIVWVLYCLVAMVVTRFAWGQLIAWSEPRVQATGMILLAALAIWTVTRFVDRSELTAVANIGMGIVPWLVVSRAQAIRHPVDPIGGSRSSAIQTYYLLILLAVAALAATLLVWLWIRDEIASGGDGSRESEE